MTQHYWQRYKDQISMDPMHIDDPFWKAVRSDIDRMNGPKHHLQLYSMCKSQNPYIKQIKNSPNITLQTVAELICRDKACQLQYCLSLMRIATQNKRNKIDLKGCKEQYNTMWNCIKVQRQRVIAREQQLKNLIKGIQKPIVIQQKLEQKKTETERVVYI